MRRFRVGKLAAGLFLSVATAVILPAQTFTKLHDFCSGSCSDGAQPAGQLVQGTDGKLYGTAYSAGSKGYGTFFQMTSSGTVTVLHNFTGLEDGAKPYAGVIQAKDGSFYGVTSIGGNTPSGCGTVYRVTTGGSFTWLHRFAGYTKDGCNAWPPLTQASDGNFYGTSNAGGTSNLGTVFQITSGGALTILHSFTGGSDGVNPLAGLMQASNGNLYGEAAYGGSGYGTIFRISLGGSVTTLHSFNGSDGYEPVGGLLQALDGTFYGTTYGGGAGNSGTVFKMAADGTLTTLYNFCAQNACADGHGPYGAMVRDSNGNLYGTTFYGGAYNGGTVFTIDSSGVFNRLHSFCAESNCTDGSHPYSGLTLANDGKLYGVTEYGGSANYGTAFSLTVPPSYLLSVAKTGSGTVTSTDGSINCGATCSHLYISGTEVALSAAAAQGYQFSNWSGCDSVNGNVCTVAMNNSRTATATFLALNQLSVAKVGGGTVTSSDGNINCGATCSHTYVSGTVVVLTATSAQGYAFTGWTGCDQPQGNVCSLTMNNARTLRATFKVTYLLTVSKTGTGLVTSGDGGIYCPTVCSHLYPDGTQVVLTAAPGAGFTVSGWTGCDSVQTTTCRVTVGSARNVTAIFTQVQAVLSSLTFKPVLVKGDGVSIATITLAQPAPAGALGVAMSSDHNLVVHPPSVVVIPGGRTSVSFAVRASPVRIKTIAKVTASVNPSQQSATLTVTTDFAAGKEVDGIGKLPAPSNMFHLVGR